MAIVKVNYAKNAGSAKASIRYMQHRPGGEGEKITRSLFGSDGLMGRYEAYRMIDEAEKGSRIFRIVINPDMKTEDPKRDLNLREVLQTTIQELSQQLHQDIAWVGVVHADHKPHRHIHAIAIANERLLPVVAMRQTATQVCLEQRHERDLAREQQEQRKEAQWERER